MTAKEITQGLNCPNCGGMVPVPEGQVIVQCPFCALRSLVRGERGLLRYQVPLRVDRQQAIQAMQSFFSSHRNIAAGLSRQASLQEAFVAHLPFWGFWARVLGWVFGEERIRRDNETRYKPKEARFTREVNWTGAACDVGEFGVESLALAEQPLEPFKPEALHASGLVFEPVGSQSQARATAQGEFESRVQDAARMDRIGQVNVRLVRQRMALVYYPLWVLRYLYRKRAFQVVVDGYSGQVLYGKAPGSTFYRAAVLVGGMLLGAFLAVDIAAAAFALGAETGGDGSEFFFFFGIAMIAAGIAVMTSAYRAFRHGEQFEYRRHGRGAAGGSFDIKEILTQVEGAGKWIDRFR